MRTPRKFTLWLQAKRSRDFRVLLPCFAIVLQCQALGSSACDGPLFDQPEFLDVGPSPRAFAAADFNGDSYFDLAVATYSHSDKVSTLQILLGDGGGVQPHTAIDLLQWVTDIVVGDFDGNGILDVAVAHSGTSDGAEPDGILVFPGDGDGGFHASVNSVVGTAPSYIVAAEFNSDDRLDLAFVNASGDGGITVLFNDGDGSFTSAAQLAKGFTYARVAAADLNGDANDDLVISASGGEYVAMMVYLNDGQGGFMLHESFTPESDVEDISLSDLDGDGAVDLVAALSYFGVMIAFGDGHGVFTDIQSVILYDTPQGVSVKDVNQDGMDDVLVSHGSFTSWGVVSVFHSKGARTFSAPISYFAAQGPGQMCVVDFDHDGDPDILTLATWSADSVSVLFNGGEDSFMGPRLHRWRTNAIAVGDLDNDGDPDLAMTATAPNQMFRIAINNEGILQEGMLHEGIDADDIAVGDINGDGELDLVMAIHGYNGLLVWHGNGDGTFVFAFPSALGFLGRTVDLADMDGDDDLDAVVGHDDEHAFSVVFNQDGTLNSAYTYFIGGEPRDIVAADLEQDGDIDVAVTSASPAQVSVFTNTGKGILAPGLIFSTGSGMANFAEEVAAADMNADGFMDFVVAHYAPLAGYVVVFLSDGKMNFEPTAYSAGDGVQALAVSDIDVDGDLDVIIGHLSSGDLVVLHGQGDGALAAPTSYIVGGITSAVVAVDLDQNGAPDLVADAGPWVAVLHSNACVPDAGDLNHDSVVDDVDLTILLAAWGQCDASDCAADLDGDGIVGPADLAELLANWG